MVFDPASCPATPRSVTQKTKKQAGGTTDGQRKPRILPSHHRCDQRPGRPDVAGSVEHKIWTA